MTEYGYRDHNNGDVKMDMFGRHTEDISTSVETPKKSYLAESENSPPGDGNSKIGELGKNLMETTTCHGIGRIYGGTNCYRKSFWTLVFMVATSMFLWQFSELLINYYDRDVTVSLDIKFDRNLNFPAVTICNLNPIKLSIMAMDENLREMFGFEAEYEPTLAPAPGPPGTGPPLGTMAPTPSSRKRRHLQREKRADDELQNWDTNPPDYDAVDTKMETAFSVYDYMGAIEYEQRMRFGHGLKTFLVDCTWKGYPCGPGNFTKFYNYMYGNCFTFNSGEDGTTQATNNPGPLHDLKESAGARLLIHPQNVMPFPEDNGLTLQPGTETNVGLRKVVISRQPYPYGDCETSTKVTSDNNIFTNFFGTEYSQQSCEKSCFYSHVVTECGCSDAKFRYNTTYSPCTSSNETQRECKESVENLYLEGKLSCDSDCPQRCEDDDYRMTVTSGLWPNNVYVDEIISDVQQMSTDLHSRATEEDNFAYNNLLKVNIYYEQFNYESITESPAYQAEDFLSDVGGQMGLWIGMSVITIFEFLEFVFDICSWIGRKCTGKKKRSTLPI
ncbi:epithelial sodium channel subunit alpha-like [Saccoglossus kowalevskii]|uniref:Degenerin deg-1-like n=1 Tax=Saccoglossus kowalevskii TaxID=10224 RepID=A0ABM0M5D8_SACKO|nr:PREDICTED: degenerin deg-1-like [Saccoglossus kowalevskii]